jgi:glutaredoxin-related protein
MKEDILQVKIKRELGTLPINTESRVLYLLVEIRKVLEHDDVRESILRFYADWVVHTKLDKSFSQKIYEELKSRDSRGGANILNFERLRKDLKQFLIKYQLPTDLVEVDKHWISFRENLIDILIDVPIVRKQEKIVGTFEFQRRSGAEVEFYMKDEKGEVLGRMFI